MSYLGSALAGAIAAGTIQLLAWWRRRRAQRERDGIVHAMVSDVLRICGVSIHDGTGVISWSEVTCSTCHEIRARIGAGQDEEMPFLVTPTIWKAQGALANAKADKERKAPKKGPKIRRKQQKNARREQR